MYATKLAFAELMNYREGKAAEYNKFNTLIETNLHFNDVWLQKGTRSRLICTCFEREREWYLGKIIKFVEMPNSYTQSHN